MVIVAVDSKSVAAIGVRPPIPRSYYASLLDRLRAAGPRVIALDAQLNGKTDQLDDRALRAAIARDGPILLATHEASAQNGSNSETVPVLGVRSLPGAILASAAVDNDPDNVLRRMIYTPVRLKTLAVRAAELFTGRRVSQQEFPGNHAWVDFRGPPGTFRQYSLIDVLRGRVPSHEFYNKAVLVGVTEPAEKDIFVTAASSRPMSGVEFHANALTTILDGFPLKSASDGIQILLLFVLAAIPALLSLRLSALYVIVAAIGVLLMYLVAVQLAFNSGRIISVPDPILALGLGTIGSVGADSFVQRRQLRNLQEMFDLLPSPVSDFFISYRQGQSELAANTLREGLTRRFGEDSVFMDTDAIDAGQEWPRRIEDAIIACRAMLVVIGPRWFDAKAPDGSRRLDNAADWVRREIESGLARDEIAVVPVLHDGASVSDRDQLPDSIKALARCQAVQLTGRELESWIDALAESIQKGRLRDFTGFERPATTP